jgi:hypothetical protein
MSADKMRVEAADVRELMRTAVHALKREDTELRAAFSALGKRAKAGLNRGLGYWLYETTLVYIVFKEWIRRKEHVVWDWPEGDERKRVDLRVQRKWKDQWGFEFKWCNTTKGTTALADDAIKLQQMIEKKTLARGFLVAVWWNKRDARAPDGITYTDSQWMQDVAKDLEVDVRFVDTFPTHIVAKEMPKIGKREIVGTRSMRSGRGVRGVHHFAVAAFEVRPCS